MKTLHPEANRGPPPVNQQRVYVWILHYHPRDRSNFRANREVRSSYIYALATCIWCVHTQTDRRLTGGFIPSYTRQPVGVGSIINLVRNFCFYLSVTTPYQLSAVVLVNVKCIHLVSVLRAIRAVAFPAFFCTFYFIFFSHHLYLYSPCIVEQNVFIWTFMTFHKI